MRDDNQDRDFIEACRKIDFSGESLNRERNLEILKSKLKNLQNQEEKPMKLKMKKITALAVAAAALLCLSVAAYGQDLIRIIKTVTLGSHASYSVVEAAPAPVPIPENLRGLVFDKDGNALVVFPEDGALYNEKGEIVRPIFEGDQARVLTEEEFQARREANRFIYRDREEAKGYFICDTLSPSYLPEGYQFDRIEFYGDPASREGIEQGANKYMGVHYSNGKDEMYSQIRYMDEETAFQGSATEEVKEIAINGYAAVLDKNTLAIQIDDVMYMFFVTESMSTDELIKMAESLE